VSRVAGWEKRVAEKIEELEEEIGPSFRRFVPICCDVVPWVNVTKNGKNNGRYYCKCKKCRKWLCFMDDEDKSSPEGKPSPSTRRDAPLPTYDDFSSLLSQTPVTEMPKELPTFEWTGEGYGPNEAQMEAINHATDTPRITTAPPGSGKTFMLENRIAHLIANGAAPGSILNVTLSKAMADEGAARVEERLVDLGVHVAEDDMLLFRKWWCTIHAACYRMLAEEGDKRSVANTWQIKKIIEGQIERLMLDPEAYPWWELDTLIKSAKMRGYSSGEDHEYFFSVCDERFANVCQIRAAFDREMLYYSDKYAPHGLTTFEDMLFDVERRLKLDEGFRRKWQGQFKFVINDEGQDTTLQQMNILGMLTQSPDDGANIFTVGDPDQMLYRFAGATPEENVGVGFERRFNGAKRGTLVVNYRSFSEITDACNRLIAYNYADKGGPYPQRLYKEMTSNKGAGGSISLEEYDNIVLEGVGVADRIENDLENGYCKPGDVFVLSRIAAGLGPVETELLQRGIPFINRNGIGFWGMGCIKWVTDYVSVVKDGSNSDAFHNICNIASDAMPKPMRFLGNAFKKAFPDYDSVREASQSGMGLSRWRGAIDIVDFVEQLRKIETLSELLETIIWRSVYPYILHQYGEDAVGTREDVDDAESGKMIQLLISLQRIANRFSSVEEFLAFVEKARKAVEDANDKTAWHKYVILSTIHKVKGLERDIVYVLHMSEGEVEKNGEIVKKIGMLPYTYALSSPPPKKLYSPAQSRIEDERCIAYVAISRAKKNVRISSICEHPYLKGTMRPSRFAIEAGLKW